MQSQQLICTHCRATLTTDQGGEEGAVAVSGQYAFTTEVGNYYNDGRIHIYDVSNPSSPVYLRSQGLLGGGMHYHGLLAVGASYLIAISNESWTAGTMVPRIQHACVRAWARLFGLPVISAINS